MASRTTIARLTQAGVIPVGTNSVFCEIQLTWARPDAAEYGALYSDYAPNYKAAMESYLISKKDLQLMRDIYKQCKPSSWGHTVFYEAYILHVAYAPSIEAGRRIRKALGINDGR